MGLVGKAANAQPLRRGVGAVEHGGGPRADPAVFVAEVPFQFVPSVAQAGGVAGEGEIDHVGAVAGIEFGAQSGGQQIVDSSLVGGAIAAGAEQGVGGVAGQAAVAIGAAQEGLEAAEAAERRPDACLLADGGQASAQQEGGAPLIDRKSVV